MIRLVGKRVWAGAVLCLGILVLAPMAFGQQRQLVISSNADSAAVFVDGEWMGLVVDGPFRIPEASKQVVVRAPGAAVWSIDPLWFELSESSSQRISLDARFDYHYRFESAPSGARVLVDQQVLGQTPLLHTSESPLRELVEMELDGYLNVSVQPGEAVWNYIPVELSPVGSAGEATRTDHILEKSGPNWLNIAVTATSFAAGALAVHYRTKADNRFDDYGVSGKESLRSDIRRLDVQSGVALGAMQAGLGFVAFRLAF